MFKPNPLLFGVAYDVWIGLVDRSRHNGMKQTFLVCEYQIKYQPCAGSPDDLNPLKHSHVHKHKHTQLNEITRDDQQKNSI